MQSNDICDYCKAQDRWSCLVGKDYHMFSGIEVEPVRHGHWLYNRSAKYPTCECSLCGTEFDEQIIPFEYCPHCGARMDGGINEK